MQFGPTSRMPASAATRTSSASTRRPSSPVSPNPDDSYDRGAGATRGGVGDRLRHRPRRHRDEREVDGSGLAERGDRGDNRRRSSPEDAPRRPAPRSRRRCAAAPPRAFARRRDAPYHGDGRRCEQRLQAGACLPGAMTPVQRNRRSSSASRRDRSSTSASRRGETYRPKRDLRGATGTRLAVLGMDQPEELHQPAPATRSRRPTRSDLIAHLHLRPDERSVAAEDHEAGGKVCSTPDRGPQGQGSGTGRAPSPAPDRPPTSPRVPDGRRARRVC